MRGIDRIRLLELIGQALQAQMVFADINVYLKGHGVDIKKPTSSTNSKRIYSKELLADESDELLLQIAEELGIDHGFGGSAGSALNDSTFWKTSHFRLFISHVSALKDKASLLQKALLDFGISGFVAHEDIEPTREWMIEIEKALFSMDALVALVTPEFVQSRWTDQEVGVAIGRGVLVIPVRRGADPHGFIGKYQGFQSAGKSVADVAAGLFEILGSNNRTLPKLTQALVDQVLVAASEKDGNQKLKVLSRIETPPMSQLERLRSGLDDNAVLRVSRNFVADLNTFLHKYGLERYEVKATPAAVPDDDVPF